MSVSFYESPEVTYDDNLSVIYESVVVPRPQLERVLGEVVLENPQDKHIHITSRPLHSQEGKALIGQCVKVNPFASPEEERQRKSYIKWLFPEIEEDNTPIQATTFVFVDMTQIAIQTFAQAHVNSAGKARLPEVEGQICKTASQVLSHELIHASIDQVNISDLNPDEVKEGKQDEESVIEEKLATMGKKIPPRLVNARLLRNRDMGVYRQLLRVIHARRTS